MHRFDNMPLCGTSCICEGPVQDLCRVPGNMCSAQENLTSNQKSHLPHPVILLVVLVIGTCRGYHTKGLTAGLDRQPSAGRASGAGAPGR